MGMTESVMGSRMGSKGLFIASQLKATLEISAAVYCTVGLCMRLTNTEQAKDIHDGVTQKKLELESKERELKQKQDPLCKHTSLAGIHETVKQQKVELQLMETLLAQKEDKLYEHKYYVADLRKRNRSILTAYKPLQYVLERLTKTAALPRSALPPLPMPPQPYASSFTKKRPRNGGDAVESTSFSED